MENPVCLDFENSSSICRKNLLMDYFSPPASTSLDTDQRKVISVAELNRQARRLLEISFASVWVKGEISNLARPASGHWYFTLKDSSAQIRAAMFRSNNQQVRFLPKEGQQVLIRARVSLYEERGDYQLIVNYMEEAGEGALRLAFEELKNKLAQEGLFDASRKQPLPGMPGHIGVITSPTGAAIRDILTVMKRRFPATRVTVIPTAVQGNEAAGQIVRALRIAGKTNDIDVLVIGRGGGSLEDLWPFNEEPVARAIAACRIPIVSAVGHEIDFTIADLVADYRAPTPSAAAEILTRHQDEWRNTPGIYQKKLISVINARLHLLRQTLNALGNRLRHPGHQLQEHCQRLDDLSLRLQHAMRHQLLTGHNALISIDKRLRQISPLHLVQRFKLQNHHFDLRLNASMQTLLSRLKQQMAHLTDQLGTLGPLATLSRGYAMARTSDGTIIRNSQTVTEGDNIKVNLASGYLICSVTEIH